MGVTGGLGWARDDHAVSVVDARCREIVRRGVEYTAAGLGELIGVLTGAEVASFNKIRLDTNGAPDAGDLQLAWAADATAFRLTPR